jgi:hypothetical protein
MFCGSGIIFGGPEGVGSCCQVLRSRNRFRRCRVRQVQFSCFAHPDSFSTVPRATGPVLMFLAPGLVFDGTEGVRSRFHILRARTRFRRYRARQVPFFRGRRVLYSCFACPDRFSAVSSASGPFFKFCTPGIIFGGIEGVRSRFHVLRARTRFRRYRGRRVPFSCFARPDSFSTVPRASGPVFMLCGSGIVFGGTECVGSRFHVLCAQTRFRPYRGRRIPFSYFAL